MGYERFWRQATVVVTMGGRIGRRHEVVTLESRDRNPFRQVLDAIGQWNGSHPDAQVDVPASPRRLRLEGLPPQLAEQMTRAMAALGLHFAGLDATPADRC